MKELKMTHQLHKNKSQRLGVEKFLKTSTGLYYIVVSFLYVQPWCATKLEENLTTRSNVASWAFCGPDCLINKARRVPTVAKERFKRF